MTDKPLPPDGEDDADRPDPVLRRALAHAPDIGAVPDFRVGKAIRRLAHAAVAPEGANDPLLPMRPPAPPWWRRLWSGRGGPHARMPWNAAFATVLVGVLITVLWQREPVPGPQLDSPAPAPSVAPVPAPRAPAEASAPAAPPRIALPPTVAEAPALPPAPVTPPPATGTPRTEAAPPAAASKQAGKRGQGAASTEGERKATVPLARPAPSAPALAPVPVAPAPPPPVVAPQSANDQALAAAPDRRAAATARMREPMAPPASAAAPAGSSAELAAPAEPPPQPQFTALGQWTRMTVTSPTGEVRSFARADARELGALLGSAALTAIGPQRLRSRVEWRVVLESDGKPLAQFELAGREVRWRENGMATTGQPPDGALDGLRVALREAMAAVPR